MWGDRTWTSNSNGITCVPTHEHAHMGVCLEDFISTLGNKIPKENLPGT